ncbi:twisted gastrulation (Tsg) protein conserved region domain-containing protein [Ditylenchus destructor]|nr:twisted gastrulation (Tsg) protein conserved region domain-containing protein [Ditylenchus destructor]
MIIFALCTILALLCQFAITSEGSHILLDVNDSCLERKCGPRVSKCMLIGACNCSMTAEQLRFKQCPCCRECIKCLVKELDNILGSPESTNCTLIYVNECMSHKRCEQTCKTMGASSLRWFHTGCCQCIGSFCLKYGSDKDRCNDCKSSPSPNEESDGDNIIDQNRSHVTNENDQEL